MIHNTFDQKISRQDRSLKELTEYEWNLLADSAAFFKGT